MIVLPLMLLVAAAQPPRNLPLPPRQDEATIAVRPGQAPPGSRPAPLTETAEPVALAFAGFDADQDGQTSRTEVDAALARTFAAADANRDGGLGYIEYAAWATTWLGSATALPGPYAIDANGDDSLSRDEFSEAFRRVVARLDRNGDGVLVRAELLTVRNPVRERLRPEVRERIEERRRARR